MTFLQSNITNDKIRYEIKIDYIDFEIVTIDKKKEIIKLVKFFLQKVDDKDLPIKIKMNDYSLPKDMEVQIDDINDTFYRFVITLTKLNFKKFFKINFEKMFKNKYDLELDYYGRWKHNWYELKTDNHNDYISFDCDSHPLGTLFKLDSISDPEETLLLINKMINILDKAKIHKPFKFRFNNTLEFDNIDYLSYDTSRRNTYTDYLIKFNDFVNFFKKNIIYLAENSRIKYNLDIEEPVEDDDGWTISVNTKKAKSIAHGVAKRALYEKFDKIEKSV